MMHVENGDAEAHDCRHPWRYLWTRNDATFLPAGALDWCPTEDPEENGATEENGGHLSLLQSL